MLESLHEETLNIVGTALRVGHQRVYDYTSTTRKPGRDTSTGTQGCSGGMPGCPVVVEGTKDNVLRGLGGHGRRL